MSRGDGSLAANVATVCRPEVRSIVLLLLLASAAAPALAGIDKPWQEESDGGSMPGASTLLGVVGAIFMIYQGVKDSESVGSIAVAAVLGYSLGSLVGLPIGCMVR